MMTYFVILILKHMLHARAHNTHSSYILPITSVFGTEKVLKAQLKKKKFLIRSPQKWLLKLQHSDLASCEFSNFSDRDGRWWPGKFGNCFWRNYGCFYRKKNCSSVTLPISQTKSYQCTLEMAAWKFRRSLSFTFYFISEKNWICHFK